jgi:anaerobic dimethyl sulfoxide reductase subunit A
LSEDKKESIADKKVSRRTILKWTGGLAAAAVIGGAAVYGATYKSPPPPPPSLKPPLSPEIQSRVDQITKDLIDRHTGETICYGGCSCNCGGTGCFFKYHVKNGVLTAIEPDDTHYPQVGMEDKVMTQKEFDWGLINRRGCAMNYGMIDYLYSPDRIIYPIKRAPGTPRGGGQWVRTTWDDSINTIATNMKQLKDQYGPFFLLNPYGGRTAGCGAVFTIFGAGTLGYGLCSDDCAMLMGPFTGLGGYGIGTSPGNDNADMLKYSKLQILLGMSNYTTHFGGSAWGSGWYHRLGREKGTPIIQIDPKYTWDAEIVSDQWIPIKPGTDTALMMAMCYVILTEGLYDKAWVDKYMYGFQQQADYILGKGGKGVPYPDWNAPGYLATGFSPDYTNYDTIPKTPQWAEKITGIPAATIQALGELYGKTKPAVFMEHFGAKRKSYGEYGYKMQLFMNLLTGNGPAVHGGWCGSTSSTSVRTLPAATGTLPAAAATIAAATQYAAPTFYRSFHWWKAVSYATRVLNGGQSILYPGTPMTWREWGNIVGFNAAPQFLTMFNPKMLWGNASNQVVMGENSNAQIRAMLDPTIVFSFHQHNRITTSGKYTDMILPIACPTFEQTAWANSGYGGFDSNQIYAAPGLPLPGETALSTDYTACRILENIGGLSMAHQYWSNYNGAATFNADMDKQLAAGWNANRVPWLIAHGVANPPTWDQVKVGNKGHGLTQFHPAEWYPTEDTYCGQNPPFATIIDTKTGKGEIYTDALTDNSTRGKEHFDYKGRKYSMMPNDWRDLQPISVYHPCFNGMEDYPKGKLKTYPLMILTTNTRFHCHYLYGDPGNDRTRDAYRHSVIMSATDAKARGIKDNDIVRVWNDQGQVAVPVYVTNRIMPGVVQLRTGMGPNVTLKTFGGLDACIPPTRMGACVNTFTGGDDFSTITPAKVTSLVECEKMSEGTRY